MPLPFILAGAAIAAASYGAKKGYDGYQDKTKANEILETSKDKYERSKVSFDTINNKTTESLTQLGELQLQVGEDFKDFRTMAEDLLAKLNKYGEKDIVIDFPQHKLNKIDGLALSTTTYLSKVAGAGIAGAAAAYAVYGGVMALATASTGTSIATLSGAAAYNAAMAAIGGGSIAAGGFGMAGGAMVLGSVVAAPIIAIAGWAFASHAEDALNDARKVRDDVNESVEKLKKGGQQLTKTRLYVEQLHAETTHLYTIFTGYFDNLKYMNQLIEDGTDPDTICDDLLQIIENGYKVATILTDIITTPLFKPKKDAQGQVVLNEDNVVVIEIDKDGMQVLNESAIQQTLTKAKADTIQL